MIIKGMLRLFITVNISLKVGELWAGFIKLILEFDKLFWVFLSRTGMISSMITPFEYMINAIYML